MNRLATTISLVIISFCGIMTHATPSAAPASMQTAQSQQGQTQWIEIGEVTLTHRFLPKRNQTAVLYVMQLGDKFIYRIKWNDRYYTVNQYDNDKYNACVEIPDGIPVYGTDGKYRFVENEGKYKTNVPRW